MHMPTIIIWTILHGFYVWFAIIDAPSDSLLTSRYMKVLTGQENVVVMFVYGKANIIADTCTPPENPRSASRVSNCF